MNKDMIYTAGVIAVRECALLGDKLNKMCEETPQDAFRMLTESGFGQSADAPDAYAYEKLITAEERALDAFVDEYAPDDATRAYLLIARDYFNAKAIVKAHVAKTSTDGLLAPDGMIPSKTIADAVQNGKLDLLPDELAMTIKSALAYSEETADLTYLGPLFKSASYMALGKICKRKKMLSSLVNKRVDGMNVLLAYRCESMDEFSVQRLPGGTLKDGTFSAVFKSAESAEHAFAGTPYEALGSLCAQAKQAGRPLTEAEKWYEETEMALLMQPKYRDDISSVFLRYVIKRKCEIANVRIVMACLLAGLDGGAIHKRLRGNV